MRYALYSIGRKGWGFVQGTGRFLKKNSVFAAWSGGIAAAFYFLSPWAAVPLLFTCTQVLNGYDEGSTPSVLDRGSNRKLKYVCRGVGQAAVKSFNGAALLFVSLFIHNGLAPFHSFIPVDNTKSVSKALLDENVWAVRGVIPVKEKGEYYTAVIKDIRHIRDGKGEVTEAEAEVRYMTSDFWTGNDVERTVVGVATRPSEKAAGLTYPRPAVYGKTLR